jgi:hypothetical protein
VVLCVVIDVFVAAASTGGAVLFVAIIQALLLAAAMWNAS